VERIITRIEAGPQGVDTRYIVTSLKSGSARSLYEGIYCRRGQAENRIKAWERHLAADRTSCTHAAANQFRRMPVVGLPLLIAVGLRRLLGSARLQRYAGALDGSVVWLVVIFGFGVMDGMPAKITSEPA
jgi:hypothetical protein